VELKNLTLKNGGRFELKNVSDRIQGTLSLIDFDSFSGTTAIKKIRSSDLLTRLGDGTVKVAADLKYLISFFGSVCLAMLYALIHPRSLRKEDTLLNMQKIGVDAVPIVGLICFLLGLILAFMSSIQLRQFGADIYVASLVSLALVRELGPVMTAIIVAGRSGSAFAAEIGCMKVSEEVDALYTMGFEPALFLVVPKVLAALIVVPLLTLFADLFGLLGSLAVGVFLLKLSPNAYMDQSIRFLSMTDLYWSFFKSGVFALLITWIGCLRGFQVKGGAASVGQASTSAVVSSLFLIIMTDSIFAVIRVYWG
ncbi:MAG: ABC transporter permease, partial [Candidatus Adiutricales bacterium]